MMLQLGGVRLLWILVILCDISSCIFAALSVNLNRRHGGRVYKSPTSPTMSVSH